MKLPKENEILKLEWKENILRYMENFPFPDIYRKLDYIKWIKAFKHEQLNIKHDVTSDTKCSIYSWFTNTRDIENLRQIFYNPLTYDL